MTERTSEDTTPGPGSPSGDPPASGGEGSQESPVTVESLQKRLGDAEQKAKAAEAAQGAADRTAAQSSRKLDDLTRALAQNASAADDKQLRTDLRDHPVETAERLLGEMDQKAIEAAAKKVAMEEGGEIFLQASAANAAYSDLTADERQTIQDRLVAEGRGATEVVAAWTEAVAVKRSGSSKTELEALTTRLDAVEKGETADILNGENNGPATPGGGTPNAGGDQGKHEGESKMGHINRLKKSGQIDTAEWNKRKDALTNV
jgi:hypothetical protein